MCDNECDEVVVPSLSESSGASSDSLSRESGPKIYQNKDGHDDSGGHHETPPSIISALVSGVINWLLMFGLCCAYGMIMFSDDWNQSHRALAVKMNLSTAFILGLLLAAVSKIPVAIGGPDLNPVVFLGSFVSTIAERIAAKHGLRYPSGDVDHRRLLAVDARHLGGDPDSSAAEIDFCTHGGEHFATHVDACTVYHEELRATVIFTVAASSAAIGALFFCLGKFKLTKYVSYVPTCIMEAFLSCVGYKVFKYALTFCRFDPIQFVPAACVGVPLYFVKAHHIGNPALLIPLMLLVPLGLFYAYVFGIRGDTMAMARQKHLMFPHMENVEFYRIWCDCLFVPQRVDPSAFLATGPNLIIMMIVVLLDCLLKISSTEAKLPVLVDKDHEIKLHGVGNVFTVVCGSSVGYMQLKFNVINYGVLGNARDRRGGFVYAVLCGICFFGTIEAINYLPCFFLGTLLFFAGAGFVAENLWGSRKYLSFHEWIQVFVILGVFIITNSLLIAVVIGGMLTGIDFIIRYSKVSCINGKPLRGGELTSYERKGEFSHRVYQHIADSWTLVIQLKGYVFFASAQIVTDLIQGIVDSTRDVPAYRRLRFIVFDCMQLDAMDASASKAFQKLVKLLNEMNIRCLFSSVSVAMAHVFLTRKIVESSLDLYVGLGHAILYIEERIVEYQKGLQCRWLATHPLLRLHRRLLQTQSRVDPFRQILTMDAMRRGCPWQFVNARPVVKHSTVLWRGGEREVGLYLVHSGAIGIYRCKPDEPLSDENWGHPVAVYRQGWFLNHDFLLRAPARHFAVALEDGEVLIWSEWSWFRMCRDRPFMASAISKMVMKQQASDFHFRASGEHARRSTSVDGEILQRMEREADGMRIRRSISTAGSIVADAPKHEQSSQTAASRRDSVEKAICESDESEGRKSLILDGIAKYSFAHLLARRMSDRITALPNTSQTSAFQPEELKQLLLGVRTARVLEKLKLYDPVRGDPELVIPSVPPCCVEDLTIAFETFCTTDMGTDAVLPWKSVSEALMYAGIFGTMLADNDAKRQRPLTLAEFMQVGHLAYLAPLSSAQIQQVRDVFEKHDKGRTGIITAEKLVTVFRKDFHPDISIEEVDGLAGEWDRDDVTFEKFAAIMSRLIRVHQHDWSLLRALREIVGRECHVDGFVSVDDLVKRSGGNLTREQAEEMIWAADWRKKNKGRGETLELGDLLGQVLLETDRCSGKLPPSPNPSSCNSDVKGRCRGGGTSRPSQSTAESRSIRQLPPLDLRKGLPKARSGTDQGISTKTPPLADAPSVAPLLRPLIASGISDLVIDLRDAGTVQQLRGLCPHLFSPDACEQTSSQAFDRIQSRGAAVRATSTKSWKHEEVGEGLCRRRLNLLLEEPSSSPAAKILSLVMGLMIGLSVLTLVLQPLVSADECHISDSERNAWLVVETYFTALFTVEYVVRLCVADAFGTITIRGFLVNPSNICDLLAVLPFYVEATAKLASNAEGSGGSGGDQWRLLRVARLMRLSRVLKIAKLSSQGHGSIFGPVAMVLTLIWGIYVKTAVTGKQTVCN